MTEPSPGENKEINKIKYLTYTAVPMKPPTVQLTNELDYMMQGLLGYAMSGYFQFEPAPMQP